MILFATSFGDSAAELLDLMLSRDCFFSPPHFLHLFKQQLDLIEYGQTCIWLHTEDDRIGNNTSLFTFLEFSPTFFGDEGAVMNLLFLLL